MKKKKTIRYPKWVEESARECFDEQLSQSAKLSILFRKLLEGDPEDRPSPEEIRQVFDNLRQSKAVNFQKTEAIRAEILKRQPSPEEVQEALVQRTKDALKIIVEHGALSSGDFAEKLYSDSPRWEMEENAREAKKLLRDLTKRGLLQYCRKSHVYYPSEDGKWFLREGGSLSGPSSTLAHIEKKTEDAGPSHDRAAAQ